MIVNPPSIPLSELPLDNGTFTFKVSVIINTDDLAVSANALRTIADWIESDNSEENQRVFSPEANYSLIVKRNTA